MSPDLEMVVLFLQILRASNWTITAIIPDGKTTTRTFNEVQATVDFIVAHNADKNVYYTLNVLKPGTNLNKKPTKNDFLEIHWVHADLDPNEDESPAQAKERYLKKLAAFKYKPTVIVDSGNGVQALWRIEPITDGFERAETISRWIMLELGSKAGTQNFDRILRMPGTVNLPNKVKRDLGRQSCMALLIQYNENVVYNIEDFELPPEIKSTASVADVDAVDHDVLWWTIETGGRYLTKGERSEGVWWCVNELLRRGHSATNVRRIMLIRSYRITIHIFEQAHPEAYVEDTINDAIRKLKLARDEKTQKVIPCRYNVHVAMLKLGITVAYNMFNDRTIITGLKGYGPELTDEIMLHLRVTFDNVYSFYPPKEMTYEVLKESALLNQFHPARDYFDGVQTRWNKKKRVETWLIDYAGAEDTPYVRAVGLIWFVAHVRRVRQPGCKFDEMVVFECPIQGTNKSTSLEVLAINPDWFTDSLPLSAEPKQVIEALRGRLVIEVSELSGLRRTDIEHVKAMLSRTTDRARMAYDRLVRDVPRQGCFTGTTNDAQYLKDTGGNRRFWPVRIREFDIATLKRDLDQLWGEACTLEATGMSIRMDQSMWSAAAEQQIQRVINDSFTDELRHYLSGFTQAKITRHDVVTILGGSQASWTQDQNGRLGKAMEALGWRRPNSGGQFRFDGRLVVGWLIGEGSASQLPLVTAYRDRDTNQIIVSIEGGLAGENEPF